MDRLIKLSLSSDVSMITQTWPYVIGNWWHRNNNYWRHIRNSSELLAFISLQSTVQIVANSRLSTIVDTVASIMTLMTLASPNTFSGESMFFRFAITVAPVRVTCPWIVLGRPLAKFSFSHWHLCMKQSKRKSKLCTVSPEFMICMRDLAST